MGGVGVPPKPPSKRRRTNKPASYGAAERITTPAAPVADRELGIDSPHQLVADLWEVIQTSAESRFYSAADWARLRIELWFANALLTSGKPIVAGAWQQVQHGLTELLISPAAKRRAAIELKPPDPDPTRSPL